MKNCTKLHANGADFLGKVDRELKFRLISIRHSDAMSGDKSWRRLYFVNVVTLEHELSLWQSKKHMDPPLGPLTLSCRIFIAIVDILWSQITTTLSPRQLISGKPWHLVLPVYSPEAASQMPWRTSCTLLDGRNGKDKLTLEWSRLDIWKYLNWWFGIIREGSKSCDFLPFMIFTVLFVIYVIDLPRQFRATHIVPLPISATGGSVGETSMHWASAQNFSDSRFATLNLQLHFESNASWKHSPFLKHNLPQRCHLRL